MGSMCLPTQRSPGEKIGKKGKTHGLKSRQFERTEKEVII